WRSAAVEYRLLVEAEKRAVPRNDERLLARESTLATILGDLAEYDESERLLRHVVSAEAARLPAGYARYALDSAILGEVLTRRGRYDEAEKVLSGIRADLPKQLPPDHYVYGFVERAWVRLCVERGRFQEALLLLEPQAQRSLAKYGSKGILHHLDLWYLGFAYQRAGRIDDAISTLRKVVADNDAGLGYDDPEVIAVHDELADALRVSGRRDEAWEALKSTSPKALASVPAEHPYIASRRRVEGLLLLQEG